MIENSKTILIVDDSNISRRKIIGLLSPELYTIHEGKNGFDAVNYLSGHKPDCVILDLLMPEMDGFEVLEYMKENDIKVPVVVLSADIQESTKSTCLGLGAFAFLNKPPDKQILNDTVSNAIKSKEL